MALPTAVQQVFRIGHRHLDQSELFSPEGLVDHCLVPCQITKPFCNGKKIFNQLRNENPFGDKGLTTIVLLQKALHDLRRIAGLILEYVIATAHQ
ncbi:hypothetical protein ES703_81436 [subsurface metagenome]